MEEPHHYGSLSDKQFTSDMEGPLQFGSLSDLQFTSDMKGPYLVGQPVTWPWYT